MLTIAVYGSKRQHNNLEYISTLFTLLSKVGARIVVHKKLFTHLLELLGELPREWNIHSVTDTPFFDADLAVSIGGDGTFLRTARWVGEKKIPIAGINAGHLGFLTSFDITNVETFVEILLSRKFRIENRTMIHARIPAMPELTELYALNEVVAQRAESASMITVDTVLDSAPLASYMADGVIFSTATGSTGYNLSAGGPILQPTAPSFVITPIAAHSLTMRPLVVGDNSLISFTVDSRASHFQLSLDGKAIRVPIKTEVILSKNPFPVRIILRDDEWFAEKIRQKLLWGVR